MVSRRRSSTDSQASQYIGWARASPGQDWQARAKGRCWRDCWLNLVDAVGDNDDDLLVLAAGRNPTEVPGCGLEEGSDDA